MPNIAASIITIGDELLIGQVIDTNSAWIAQRLNQLGIAVVMRMAVGDDADAIGQALDESMVKSDVVLITGGLGPTADDITKPFLCSYFNCRLVVNEEVLTHVTSFFKGRNLPILERNAKQAEVPDNCTVLFNKMGTAPGMLFERDGKLVISIPGVPHEMMHVMEDQVLPRLQRQFISDAIVHRTIITAGQGESFVAERIQELERALPAHIRLAYLPAYRMVRLRLTGTGRDKMSLIKEVEMRQEEIANRLEDIVVSLEDLTLEEIAGRTLFAQRRTIGLAESCTGGYIAHRFTQIIGASEFFNGSIVCYQKEIKERLLHVDKRVIEEHGVVSEAVVSQMARGARNGLNSDYGFGITGILSQGGDYDELHVGTVWMAVCDAERVATRKFHFPFDRIRNKEAAATMAFLMIWKFINHK